MKIENISKRTGYSVLSVRVYCAAKWYLINRLESDEKNENYSKELDADVLLDDAFGWAEQITDKVMRTGDIPHILNSAYVTKSERKQWMIDEVKDYGLFILETDVQREVLLKLITGLIEKAFIEVAVEREYQVHNLDKMDILLLAY